MKKINFMLFAWLSLSKWELLICCLFVFQTEHMTNLNFVSRAICCVVLWHQATLTEHKLRHRHWRAESHQLSARSAVHLEEKHFMTHTGMQCNTSLTSIILFPWRWEANWSWNLITCPLLKEAKTGLGPQHKFYSSSIQALTCKSGRSQWGSRWKRSMVSGGVRSTISHHWGDASCCYVVNKKKDPDKLKMTCNCYFFYYYMFTICL